MFCTCERRTAGIGGDRSSYVHQHLTSVSALGAAPAVMPAAAADSSGVTADGCSAIACRAKSREDHEEEQTRQLSTT